MIKIAYIGKFTRIHDEEYIARSFEALGCKVRRIPIHMQWNMMQEILLAFKPNFLFYAKWEYPKELEKCLRILKNEGTKTVCWLFDLYFDYQREFLVKSRSFFRSDFVFTSDGGHQSRFDDLDINHTCIRQGIYKEECVLLPFQPIEHEIVFVGSDSPIYPERSKLVRKMGAVWFGRKNTDEIRGMALNELYARSRIVIGDSFPSPHYWSNRVVETLGRGGFMIHKEVEGIKEAYPCLVTFTDENDLQKKIEFYRKNENLRQDIIRKNHQWVKDNYTMEKQCAKLLSCLNQ